MSSSSSIGRGAPEVAWSARLLSLSGHAVSLLAVVSFLWLLWLLRTGPASAHPTGWPESLLLIATTLATLVALARTLPAERVLLAGLLIGLLGGIAHGVGALTAVPFGPFLYSDAVGPKLFNTVAWALPLIWLIVVLNARGVAKLILRPWRKFKGYGYWLMGVTAVLVLLFDLGLEPFAASANRYWLWLPTKFPLVWYGAPLVNFLGWLLTTLLILAFITPTLTTKKTSRSQRGQVDYHPLGVWLLILALFTTTAVRNQFWPAAGLGGVTAIVVVILAVRGARW